MVKKTLRRKKSSKRSKARRTRRVRHARHTRRVRHTRRIRHTRRRRNLKGGGVDETTLEMLYPDVPRVIASLKTYPRYANALNNSDGSNEDNFRIIYNTLTQTDLASRQQVLRNRARRPLENIEMRIITLPVSWKDDDGIPKSITFYLDDGLVVSMPNKPDGRYRIYTPDASLEPQPDVMI